MRLFGEKALEKKYSIDLGWYLAPVMDHTGAIIAQWIHLYLPPCGRGFKSQAQQLRFFHYSKIDYICHCTYCEKDEGKQKEARFSPYF